MAEDGKIYIVISDKREGGTGIGQIQAPTTEAQKQDNVVLDYAKHRFFTFIESEAKTMASYSISNIGNFTGDYTAQRNVNAGVNIISNLISIGVATMSGFATAGPAGAIAGFAISVISQGVSYGLEEKSNRFANYKQNYELEKLRDLSGLNGTTNGGRI